MKLVKIGSRVIRVPRGGSVFVIDVNVPKKRPSPIRMIAGTKSFVSQYELEDFESFLNRLVLSYDPGPKTLIVAHMRNTGRGFWSAREWAKREGLRVADPYAVHALSRRRPLRDRFMNHGVLYLVSTMTDRKTNSYCECLNGEISIGWFFSNSLMDKECFYFVFQL